MKIKIRLTRAMASFNNDEKEAVCEMASGRKLDELIDLMEKQMTGIAASILAPDNTLQDSINVYVNGENIRYLDGLSTRLSDDDQVSIVPAAAAG